MHVTSQTTSSSFLKVKIRFFEACSCIKMTLTAIDNKISTRVIGTFLKLHQFVYIFLVKNTIMTSEHYRHTSYEQVFLSENLLSTVYSIS